MSDATAFAREAKDEHWEVWRYKNAAGEEVARLSGQWTDPETGRTLGFQANNVQVDVAERMARQLMRAAEMEE